MNSEEKVQRVIHDALFQYGPQTFNKLYFIVDKIEKCSNKTFARHLAILVENSKVKKREDGQKREYSLNEIDNSTLNVNLSKFLDHLLKDTKKHHPNIMKYLKKKQTKKFKDLPIWDQLAIHYAISDSIILILNWSKMLSLMITAGFSTIENRQKAKELQKLHTQALQELFAMARKIHQPIGQELFIDVLNDIKPKLGVSLANGKRDSSMLFTLKEQVDFFQKRKTKKKHKSKITILDEQI